MLIRCIDDFLHDEQKDLWTLHFTGLYQNLDVSPDDIDQHAGRNELLTWFKENLPTTKIEPIFMFTWNSGILSCPYDGTVAVHFEEGEFDKFAKRWEDSEGKSIDPRFYCGILPIEMYKERNGGKLPEKPNWDEYDF